MFFFEVRKNEVKRCDMREFVLGREEGMCPSKSSDILGLWGVFFGGRHVPFKETYPGIWGCLWQVWVRYMSLNSLN